VAAACTARLVQAGSRSWAIITSDGGDRRAPRDVEIEGTISEPAAVSGSSMATCREGLVGGSAVWRES
jgi:hypothetical protein